MGIGSSIKKAVKSASKAVSKAAQQTGSNTQNLVNDLGGEKKLVTLGAAFYAAPLAAVNSGYREEYQKTYGAVAAPVIGQYFGADAAGAVNSFMSLFSGGGSGMPEAPYNAESSGQAGSLMSGSVLPNGTRGIPPIYWIGAAVIGLGAAYLILRK